MNRFNLFFVETWNELIHKVSWPSSEDLQNSLIVVTIAILILTFLVWVMNEISELSVKFIYHLFQ